MQMAMEPLCWAPLSTSYDMKMGNDESRYTSLDKSILSHGMKTIPNWDMSTYYETNVHSRASSFGKYWHEVWTEHMKVVLVLRIYQRWEERYRRYSPIRIVHSTRHNLWTSCISTSLCEAWLIYDIRRQHNVYEAKHNSHGGLSARQVLPTIGQEVFVPTSDVDMPVEGIV